MKNEQPTRSESGDACCQQSLKDPAQMKGMQDNRENEFVSYYADLSVQTGVTEAVRWGLKFYRVA